MADGIPARIVIFLTFPLPFVKSVLYYLATYKRSRQNTAIPHIRGQLPATHQGGTYMEQRNLTLLTDLYELTMMQGYFKEKDANETVI